MLIVWKIFAAFPSGHLTWGTWDALFRDVFFEMNKFYSSVFLLSSSSTCHRFHWARRTAANAQQASKQYLIQHHYRTHTTERKNTNENEKKRKRKKEKIVELVQERGSRWRRTRRRKIVCEMNSMHSHFLNIFWTFLLLISSERNSTLSLIIKWKCWGDVISVNRNYENILGSVKNKSRRSEHNWVSLMIVKLLSDFFSSRSRRKLLTDIQ